MGESPLVIGAKSDWRDFNSHSLFQRLTAPSNLCSSVSPRAQRQSNLFPGRFGLTICKSCVKKSPTISQFPNARGQLQFGESHSHLHLKSRSKPCLIE